MRLALLLSLLLALHTGSLRPALGAEVTANATDLLEKLKAAIEQQELRYLPLGVGSAVHTRLTRSKWLKALDMESSAWAQTHLHLTPAGLASGSRAASAPWHSLLAHV